MAAGIRTVPHIAAVADSPVRPVCAWGDGEYGISDVYLGVEHDLTESELASLREAAEAVRAKQADVASR